MTKVIPINARHPLVGTWRPRDRDESAEYVIRPASTGFTVRGVDRSDGEPFEVSDVSWNGEVLRFRSVMPSTKWELLHEFRILSETEVEHCYTRREIWDRVHET